MLRLERKELFKKDNRLFNRVIYFISDERASTHFMLDVFFSCMNHVYSPFLLLGFQEQLVRLVDRCKTSP